MDILIVLISKIDTNPSYARKISICRIGQVYSFEFFNGKDGERSGLSSGRLIYFII
jgi:hypothetical protein